MALRIHSSLVPLGKEHFLVVPVESYVRMIYPWDGQEEVDQTWPGRGSRVNKTVIVLADGQKLLVSMQPTTVAKRFVAALQGGLEPTWTKNDEVEADGEEA